MLKSIDSGDLFTLLEDLAGGEAIISPTLAWNILAAMTEVEEPKETLTPREKDVLKLLVEGVTNIEIASDLDIIEHTVKFHLRNVLQKLHLRNRTEVVAYALRSGLVS